MSVKYPQKKRPTTLCVISLLFVLNVFRVFSCFHAIRNWQTCGVRLGAARPPAHSFMVRSWSSGQLRVCEQRFSSEVHFSASLAHKPSRVECLVLILPATGRIPPGPSVLADVHDWCVLCGIDWEVQVGGHCEEFCKTRQWEEHFRTKDRCKQLPAKHAQSQQQPLDSDLLLRSICVVCRRARRTCKDEELQQKTVFNKSNFHSLTLFSCGSCFVYFLLTLSNLLVVTTPNQVAPNSDHKGNPRSFDPRA